MDFLHYLLHALIHACRFEWYECPYDPAVPGLYEYHNRVLVNGWRKNDDNAELGITGIIPSDTSLIVKTPCVSMSSF
jgi:hypothetical protein